MSPAVSMRSILSVAVVLFFSASCIHVHNPPAQGPAAAAEAGEGGEEGQAGSPGAQARKGQQGEDEEEDPFKPWDDVLKDTREISGFFDLHLKRDNTLFLEVAPERLDTEFGMVLHYSRGLGDLGIQEGLRVTGNTHLLELQRRGDRIFMVRKNPRFTAEAGSGMETAMEGNVGHSVLAAWEIQSEHDSTGHLLVDATDFFVADYADISEFFKQIYGGRPVRLDQERSHVERVQAFPENVEIDAFLTFQAQGSPIFGGPGVSDVRSLPIGIRYSLFRLPADPMTPRLADTRVGHFITTQRDFSRDQEKSTYLRYVNRWRLEKVDHSSPRSEPVEPIVFYVDRSVPERYRPYVKEGIEAWNEAYEAAGFENAVVAKDAPSVEEDSTWSAEDVRYSTVQWTAAHNMGFAIGPSQVDPRTGEILNADILISWAFVRGWLNEFREMVADGGAAALAASGSSPGADEGTWSAFGPSPTAAEAAGPAGLIRRYRRAGAALMEARPGAARHLCAAEIHRMHQLGVQYAVLAARGLIAPGEPMPEEYLRYAIKDLVMHEVGHTLGLRHNFKASTDIPYQRLHDESFTGRHGVSLSVMDYVPVNVALDGERQGHYWNRKVGTYDIWAIKYAYAPVYEQSAGGEFPLSGAPVTDPFEERTGLDKIASKSDDRFHTYGTDEDAAFGPYGVDPLANRNDLGSDPLRYARDRGRLVEQVMPELEDRLIAPGDYWHRLRNGVTALLFEEYLALSHLPKMVGGLYFARDHRGQPGARTPFRPVSAERQRAAVRTLAEHAFGEDAFRLDPELLNKLSPDRWFDWHISSFSDLMPADYPVHRQVAAIQSSLLASLLHPERLHRVVDARARVASGGEVYTLGELFSTVSSAIWSEVESPGSPREVDSFRRNLQRAHLDQLESLLLEEEVQGFGGTVSIPHDARSLARLELRELAGRLERALEAGESRGLSRETLAHLEESRARIQRSLEASLTLEREE